MIVGQVNMQKDNSTKKLKMMIHDIRSPLSCLMMQCNFSMAIMNADKEDLLNFTEQILKITNSATNIDLFIRDMQNTIASFKSYCNQALRIIDKDKESLLRLIERISRILNSSVMPVKANNKKNNEINLIASINNILQEKKLECLGSNTKILFTKSENIENLYIPGSVDDFERMLSNLLNNAVEACSDIHGVVSINLDVTDKVIYLVIEDNGKGIPDNVLQQIRSGISVTSGKENGQGIGLTQIRDTISQINGKLIIKSKIGNGSKFIITIDRPTHD